jgi:hypothetical protein
VNQTEEAAPKMPKPIVIERIAGTRQTERGT